MHSHEILKLLDKPAYAHALPHYLSGLQHAGCLFDNNQTAASIASIYRLAIAASASGSYNIGDSRETKARSLPSSAVHQSEPQGLCHMDDVATAALDTNGGVSSVAATSNQAALAHAPLSGGLSLPSAGSVALHNCYYPVYTKAAVQ